MILLAPVFFYFIDFLGMGGGGGGLDYNRQASALNKQILQFAKSA